MALPQSASVSRISKLLNPVKLRRDGKVKFESFTSKGLRSFVGMAPPNADRSPGPMWLIWAACSEEEGVVFGPASGWDRETKLWSALLFTIAPSSDKIVKHIAFIALNDMGIRSKDSMGITPAAIMSAVAGSGTSSAWAAPCMPTCVACLAAAAFPGYAPAAFAHVLLQYLCCRPSSRQHGYVLHCAQRVPVTCPSAAADPFDDCPEAAAAVLLACMPLPFNSSG